MHKYIIKRIGFDDYGNVLYNIFRNKCYLLLNTSITMVKSKNCKDR